MKTRYEMMKKINLSHSQLNRYIKCGKSYEWYYIKKYRERTTSAALPFGSAIDKALGEMLEDHKAGEYPKQDYVKIFEDTWTRQRIGSANNVYLPESILLGYRKNDFNYELYTSDDISFIDAKAQELVPEVYNDLDGDLEKVIEKCQEFKDNKGQRTFKETENKFLNLALWFCLRRIGLMMLVTYQKEVMPRIKRVIEVQKNVGVKNEDGHSTGGIIDVIAELDDGNVYVLDNKTSGSFYVSEDVMTSQQLTLYCAATGVNRAGFLVLLKDPSKQKTCPACGNVVVGGNTKNCPAEVAGKKCGTKMNVEFFVKHQILLDKISENAMDQVLNDAQSALDAITSNRFIMNRDACLDWYGQRCPYFNACYRDDTSDLDKS